ncbi:MAG: hypothetical protein GXP34_14230 [Actinobacteria bacterium]|nr:hypothetical protein [Actinomycetota bacterium]
MTETTRPDEKILRFTVSDRIEHAVQVITFTGLAITGLVQKYADRWFSDWIIGLFGGIDYTRRIHHILATILLLSLVYHLGVLGYKRFVLRRPHSLIPGKADLSAAWGWIRFNLGLASGPPPEGRYTVGEKMEYWSLVWGTVLMAVTGFMLWNPIATTRFLPGVFVPAAKAAHGWEAVLAVLAIIVWHSYDVHWRHFNPSIFTGYLSRAQMKELHPLELATIDAETDRIETDPEERRNRALRYWPAFTVLAAVMLMGVYEFVTFEQTAITTVAPSPLAGPIYTPLPTTTLPPSTTPPTTTLPPTTAAPTTTAAASATTSAATPSTTAASAGVTWNSGVAAVFEAACGSCHGGSAPASGLDVTSYAGLLAGGDSGEPGFVAGDADASHVIVKVGDGSHFGKFTDEDLALVKAWIGAGAPQG